MYGAKKQAMKPKPPCGVIFRRVVYTYVSCVSLYLVETVIDTGNKSCLHFEGKTFINLRCHLATTSTSTTTTAIQQANNVNLSYPDRNKDSQQISQI